MERLKHLASWRFFQRVRDRRLVGAALLVGMAGLAVCNAEVIARDRPRKPERWLALQAPASLYERFRDARYKAARERFAFYQLAARFEGSRLLLSRPFARRHARMLRGVSRISVEEAQGDLRVSEAAAAQLARDAEFTGRLDGRPVSFVVDPGGDYALVEVGENGPILWIPRRLAGPVP
jgi:hypothetical protein